MIDTFYRIKALYELGVQVHLHCFEYGRDQSEVLSSICKSVNHYLRKNDLISHLSPVPHNVLSRRSDKLLRDLASDNLPILFDGLHTTWYLNHHLLSHRKKLVRAHNIEHRYYMDLATIERNIFKKIYLFSESSRLKLYEKKLGKADTILAISPADSEYFSARYKSSELLLPFVPFDKIESRQGNGEYIIYHGDLSVNENRIISEFLIEEVFSKVSFPCVIAGKNPSAKLKSKALSYKNITIIPDPDERQMMELIRGAHINLLPAKTSNGFKLKLLYALFAGRHCLINSTMVNGTTLDQLCYIADKSPSIVDKINALMGQSFTEEMIMKREQMLMDRFSNIKNAKKLASLLFDE